MQLINLSESDSVLNNFVAELRHKDIQGDPLRFRRNLERIGEVMAYEISRTFSYRNEVVKTRLGDAKTSIIDDRLVIGTILRAGLPFHYGFLNYFDRSENAFVSAYRKYLDKEKFTIEIEYLSSPDLNGKTIILADPMLATGISFELSYRTLLTRGMPSVVHMACIIASEHGVQYLREHIDHPSVYLWCAAIDPELNYKAYIVPGLGDAGDLAFGEKI